MSANSPPSPVEISRCGQHDVQIRWHDGAVIVYPARFLRLACPCAQCVDEMTGQRVLQDVSVAADIHPQGIEPVGRYGITIRWSDGHSTGIYTWEYLRRLAGQLGRTP